VPKSAPYVFGGLVVALLVGGPVAYAWYWEGQVRHFRVVRDGVLYRSGQPSLFALKRLINDYGIKTVVSFRDGTHPGEPPPDSREQDWCADQDINYYRLAPGCWYPPDGTAEAARAVREFCKIMDDPANYPVLIHCWGGIHRTGAFTAIYRMEYEHWTNQQAIAETRACGYTTLDEDLDLLMFLESYRPRWQPQPEPPVLTASHKVEVRATRHRKRQVVR
jgi:tyrosine-protein phosphatase SIW14